MQAQSLRKYLYSHFQKVHHSLDPDARNKLNSYFYTLKAISNASLKSKQDIVINPLVQRELERKRSLNYELSSSEEAKKELASDVEGGLKIGRHHSESETKREDD